MKIKIRITAYRSDELFWVTLFGLVVYFTDAAINFTDLPMPVITGCNWVYIVCVGISIVWRLTRLRGAVSVTHQNNLFSRVVASWITYDIAGIAVLLGITHTAARLLGWL